MARILVVDDKLAHRRFIADVLKSEGHVVEVAENGQQALDMLDQRSFDLVTLDQQMSKMTGLECYEILRTRDRRIRVVFITVFGGEPEFAQIRREGVPILVKPLSYEQIKTATANVLRGTS